MIVLSDEQRMLQDTLGGFLRDHYSPKARDDIVSSKAGWSPSLWSAFASELGILGASFPDELGGLGGGAIETMIIMREFGKVLVVEPYLGSVVIGGGLFQHAGGPQARDRIAQIIAGEMRIALAHAEPGMRYERYPIRTRAKRISGGWTLDGRKVAVFGAPSSTHLIISAQDADDRMSLFLVDIAAPGIRRSDFAALDGSRAADIRLDDVRIDDDALIGGVGEGLALLDPVLDEAVIALCAEACGVLDMLFEATLDYTRERRQFGKRLSSFQALQHRMVDMFAHVQMSAAITHLAATKTASGLERSVAASAAKARVGQACRFVGENAIQLHGGMGMTAGMQVSQLYKRAIVIENTFGAVDHHIARYADLTKIV